MKTLRLTADDADGTDKPQIGPGWGKVLLHPRHPRTIFFGHLNTPVENAKILSAELGPSAVMPARCRAHLRAQSVGRHMDDSGGEILRG